jgi:hypothetical protein
MPPPGQTQRNASKFIVFENFDKMNTQSLRFGMSERELAWEENLQPIAPNKHLNIPAPIGMSTSIPQTITTYFFAPIGGVDYLIAFTTAGSAWSINTATFATNKWAPDFTFSVPVGGVGGPDVTVWQEQRILIADSQAGYCTFDGAIFAHTAGTNSTVSPNIAVTAGGVGYTSPPSVAITGGSNQPTLPTSAPTVAGSSVLNFGITTGVVDGGGVIDTNPASAGAIQPGTVVVSHTSTTVTLSLPVVAPGVLGGDHITFSTAVAHAVLTGGVVTSVVLDNPGTGYLATDMLVVSFGPVVGPGSGAAAHAVMSGSGVLSISVVNTGFNYGFGTGISISGGGGSNAVAHAVINFQAGGRISQVIVDVPGSGYTTPPTVTATDPTGRGSGAVLVAVLNQSVASVTVDTGGSAYAGPPVVNFAGGGGSGAAAHVPTITGGAVPVPGGVTLDAGGTGYQTAPVITFTTSGTGAAASAHVWPTLGGAAVTTLAVFQGRVWLGGGQQLQWTGTQGYDDFNPANASGALLITDPDLVHKITALRALNNYLFIMGDESVKQIGNISLSPSGNVTLFTILTLSSDQGTIWPLSCGSFNRVFMFANVNGVYAVFGTSVQKISDDLDGIWPLIDFSQQPQSAVMDINSVHNIGFLVRYNDPVFILALATNATTAAGNAILHFASTAGVVDGSQIVDTSNTAVIPPGTVVLSHTPTTVTMSANATGAGVGNGDAIFFGARALILVFNGKKWFFTSQGTTLRTMVGVPSVTTGKTLVYGTGVFPPTTGDITQLLASPSGGFSFKTALTHHGNAVQRKKIIRAGFSVSSNSGETVTMTVETENGAINYAKPVTGNGFQVVSFVADGAGRYLGATLSAPATGGFVVHGLAIEYQETALWG